MATLQQDLATIFLTLPPARGRVGERGETKILGLILAGFTFL